jgi:hydrogenase expression/formation protein HypE
MSQTKSFTPECPLPITQHDHVQLAHGGGGKLMHELLESVILPAFRNEQLEARHDGAVLNIGGARLAFSTDSYVVSPMFFPGGNIGSLAVNGTVNDLAMCGARPLYLSASLILEEGLPMESLRAIVETMRLCALDADVQFVTGDTKVVDKGKGDGLFINTAGIGVVEHALTIAPTSVCPGDAVILSGDVGRHGIAIMATREGLQFESTIESDCAPLHGPVLAMIDGGIPVHCLRDPTRGGLASALIEIAEGARAHIEIDESRIAVEENVAGACEILGFDPLYLANEGRFIAFVPAAEAQRAVEIMRGFSPSAGATVIGHVSESPACVVTVRSHIGTKRVLDMISGEQLPRIC